MVKITKKSVLGHYVLIFTFSTSLSESKEKNTVIADNIAHRIGNF